MLRINEPSRLSDKSFVERGWKWMDAWIAFEKIKLPPTASTILINYSCTIKSYAVIRQLVFLQQTHIWNNNNSITMNWLDECFVVIGYFLLEHHSYLLNVDYLRFPLTENQTWHEHWMHFKGNLSRNRLSNTSACITGTRLLFTFFLLMT